MTRNLAASVRARLLQHARKTGLDDQLVLIRYAMERFLFRLGESTERDLLVLKGANALEAMAQPPHRATRDIDFLGTFRTAPETVLAVLQAVLATEVEEDGLEFDSEMRIEEMVADGNYGGFAITFAARLDGARIPVRIDIGFAQAVTPEPIETRFPTILEFPAPRIWAYPKETIVAEKLEAIVSLGIINSRLKDYFDLWFLCQSYEFEGAMLVEAVRRTFANRGTAIPAGLPAGLATAFLTDREKQRDWDAFGIRAAAFKPGDLVLPSVGESLVRFLVPVLAAAGSGSSPGRWKPGEGWS